MRWYEGLVTSNLVLANARQFFKRCDVSETNAVKICFSTWSLCALASTGDQHTIDDGSDHWLSSRNRLNPQRSTSQVEEVYPLVPFPKILGGSSESREFTKNERRSRNEWIGMRESSGKKKSKSFGRSCRRRKWERNCVEQPNSSQSDGFFQKILMPFLIWILWKGEDACQLVWPDKGGLQMANVELSTSYYWMTDTQNRKRKWFSGTFPAVFRTHDTYPVPYFIMDKARITYILAGQISSLT
ncbi:hypothetical protein GGR53DRAFT_269331 [Hypoxylon sp. FL1150]|nr:hypothetical protein GGR53DRAFT_269331 [Hypoxylon sp. FL1150]